VTVSTKPDVMKRVCWEPEGWFAGGPWAGRGTGAGWAELVGCFGMTLWRFGGSLDGGVGASAERCLSLTTSRLPPAPPQSTARLSQRLVDEFPQLQLLCLAV
jgi:hypothetical protein